MTVSFNFFVTSIGNYFSELDEENLDFSKSEDFSCTSAIDLLFSLPVMTFDTNWFLSFCFCESSPNMNSPKFF